MTKIFDVTGNTFENLRSNSTLKSNFNDKDVLVASLMISMIDPIRGRGLNKLATLATVLIFLKIIWAIFFKMIWAIFLKMI